MVTVKGWYAGGGEGGLGIDETSVQSIGETGQGFCPHFLQSTEAGSLFQFFTTLAEKADPLLRRWPLPWSTL